ncbi:hypothetical protein Poly21_13910 [Allorhodopirellula heiligendammensis]|uniref:Uncharacterized protein n=1 Tax=Allorhodopirellula heiligendammensis TaxID=2714739 RepID=A0A5C6C3R7_9BACT|nr:hypothetical protein [Allorhodopirellula heiligendammensis]TWU19220.1 hypothetical protein Poly21_13910 [Allorhodopirellula heiligendammensis]
MSSGSKVKLDEVRWLVWLFLGWTFWLASGHAPQEKPLSAPLRCSDCGGELRVVEVTYDPIVCSNERALGYFDSG